MRSIAFALLFSTPVLALAAPPPTQTRPQTDRLHGIEIVDEYRWLEGDNADPDRMGQPTEEVTEWSKAQNAHTREMLDNLPGREALESRIRELLEVGSVGLPTMERDRYFYTRREGDQEQPIVYMREGHDGEPRVLLDPMVIDSSGLTTVSWFAPSPDAELLAFGTYRAGDENSTLHLMEIDTGEWLADEIPGKVNLSGWMPDSRSFVYSRLEDLDDAYSGESRFHVVGRHWTQDPVLIRQRDVAEIYEDQNYSQEKIAQLATTWGPGAQLSEDGRWLAVFYFTGTASNDLWVVDFERFLRTGEFVKQEILVGGKSRLTTDIHGDTAFLRIDDQAPNGEIMAVDLHNPGREHWTRVVPENPNAVINGMQIARGRLIVSYLENASTRLRQFTLDGRPLGDVELPGIGSAGLSTSSDRTEAFLSFSSFNEPRSIYRVDLASNERTLWARPDVPVKPDEVVVKQEWFTSKDGTRGSMFIVHKKGLELDGDNPTVLYGYGGFNVSLTPRFVSSYYPWLENGGVYVTANLRGGGEYGDEWRRAGLLEQKQNTFDDFIAAADWLIDNGYTSSDRLAVVGGSNGGLLTGAMVTQRPDLFAAAIIAVPLLDMLRYQDFLMARYWVPEYGTAENPEHVDFLKAYSPYHNIEPGVEYPAVFLTAGENDTRVHPMHARKMAARLQAATASDPNEDPVLLWVDYTGGHGAGKPLDVRVREITDSRIFLMRQTGMLGDR
ncbi:MAG: prolyl oligopeptidase family serine peptidase [Planctomycetota bacterium]